MTINEWFVRRKGKFLRELEDFETWYKENSRQFPKHFPWDSMPRHFEERYEEWKELQEG